MKWARIKWTIVFATMIITIFALNGGQLFWQHYAVEKPLSQALQSIEGLESFYWEKNAADGSMQVHVTLHNVNNLKDAYQKINDSTARVLGQKNFSVVIHDHRTPELEQFYDSVNVYIQEAVFTGNFSTMAERIQQKAASAGIDAHVYIDAKYVYLDLKHGSADMYVTVPRQPASQEVK